MRFIGIFAGVLLMAGVAFAGEPFDDWFTLDDPVTSISSCCQVEQAEAACSNSTSGSSPGWFEVYESSWTWMFE